MVWKTLIEPHKYCDIQCTEQNHDGVISGYYSISSGFTSHFFFVIESLRKWIQSSSFQSLASQHVNGFVDNNILLEEYLNYTQEKKTITRQIFGRDLMQ